MREAEAASRSDVGSDSIGIGIGPADLGVVLGAPLAVDWLEIVPESFVGVHHSLDRVAAQHPLSLHGAGLSLGSRDPLDLDYLAELAGLAERVHARWVSDHLGWCGVGGRWVGAVLPLPYDWITLAHVAARITAVQDRLGRQLLIENPARYVAPRAGEITEPEFLARLASATGCAIRLDLGGLLVSCINCGGDPRAYLDSIASAPVAQVHLAAVADLGDHAIDSRDDRIPDSVWALYQAWCERAGPCPTVVTWDERAPSLPAIAEPKPALPPESTPPPDGAPAQDLDLTPYPGTLSPPDIAAGARRNRKRRRSGR